jgi:hypothetical protein
MTNSITCQNCGAAVTLDQAVTKQIESARATLEKQYADKNQKKLAEIEVKTKQLAEAGKKIDEQVAQKVEAEKKQLWVIAQQKASEKIEEKYALEMKDLKSQALEQKKKIQDAQEKELELRKKTRELEAKEKNIELELERKLDTERKKISLQAKEDLSEEFRKKITERDQREAQMRKQIEELKRRSEQGSMQLQGDAQENDLKRILLDNFPFDIIEDVPTGIRGADLIQTVRNEYGQKSGIILWESKNTKNWVNDWTKKLKDDQAEIKAHVSVIATTAMPDDIKVFGIKDGVWVVEYKFALALVQSLRFHLIALNKVENSLEGRDEKMQFLYKYLSGPQFKNRIENIVSAFTSMKDSLDKEKRAMNRIWQNREKELERVIHNTSGLYGDMQGMIAIPTIQALELPGEDLDTLV